MAKKPVAEMATGSLYIRLRRFRKSVRLLESLLAGAREQPEKDKWTRQLDRDLAQFLNTAFELEARGVRIPESAHDIVRGERRAKLRRPRANPEENSDGGS